MFNILFLFSVILVAETVVMWTLQDSAVHIEFYWLEIFIDASAMAATSLLAMRFLIQTKRIIPQGQNTKESLQLQAALFAFGVETWMMLLFPLIKIEDQLLISVINSSLLASITTSFIYFLLLRPNKQSHGGKSAHQHRIQSTRGFLIGCYIICLSLFLLLLLNVQQQQKENQINQLVETEKQQLALIREKLLHQISMTSLDVLILAQQENLKQVISGNTAALSRLNQDYLSLSTLKPNYEQIRYIDNKGMEIVRVDHAKGLEKAHYFQNKASRYYFLESIKLSPEEVYISPMDLNMENGRIELPFKPMVRIATPVFNGSDSPLGVIIINLNAYQMFQDLKKAAESTESELMLLNGDGYWMFGHEKEAAWAFMFNEYKDRTFDKFYPGLWKTIHTNKNGSISSAHGHFIFETVTTGLIKNEGLEIHLNNKTPTWKLVTLVKEEQIIGTLDSTSYPLLVFLVLASTVTGIVALMYDRGQQRNLKAQLKIEYLANHDPLTQLCNRRLFIDRLELHLAQVKRSNEPLALLYIDLDKFKPINDLHGHEAGDFVLKEVANQLTLLLREGDSVARLGGDEFAAILISPGGQNHLEEIAQRILSALTQPFVFNGNSLQVGISIGIAIHYKGQSVETLLHAADKAMYRAKAGGGNRFDFAELPTENYEC